MSFTVDDRLGSRTAGEVKLTSTEELEVRHDSAVIFLDKLVLTVSQGLRSLPFSSGLLSVLGQKSFAPKIGDSPHIHGAGG